VNTIGKHTYPLKGFFLRLISFIIAWWAFTESDGRDAYVGAVVVLLATLISLYILPPHAWKWNVRAWFAFIPYFLGQSFLGGLDVARRAFQPRLPIQPEIKQYPLRLPPGLPAVVLAWTVSLLPGTASIELNGKELLVHVLNDDATFHNTMRQLEERVARLFGISLT
jgi:multicomponent Na+:H+ antiporter subunit E